MDEDTAYDEQFSIDELGRSGDEIVEIRRDSREPIHPEPTHWDVTEQTLEGEYETYHVLDPYQTGLQDF